MQHQCEKQQIEAYWSNNLNYPVNSEGARTTFNASATVTNTVTPSVQSKKLQSNSKCRFSFYRSIQFWWDLSSKIYVVPLVNWYNVWCICAYRCAHLFWDLCRLDPYCCYLMGLFQIAVLTYVAATRAFQFTVLRLYHFIVAPSPLFSSLFSEPDEVSSSISL